MKRTFEKLFTRDASLLIFQMWYESETKAFRKWLNWRLPSYLLNAVNGVTEVYYDVTAYDEINKRLVKKLRNQKFLPAVLRHYRKALIPLRKVWRRRRVLPDLESLLTLYKQGCKGWMGFVIAWQIPNMPEGMATKEQIAKALAARKSAATFMEDTDRIFQKTCRRLFPRLGDLSRFIRVEELQENKIIQRQELEARRRHFIFYEGKLITSVSFAKFLKACGIKLEKISQKGKTLKGQVAMIGSVKGRVRIVLKKEEIQKVKSGEILVTSMTTPDFLPAMKKAAAFVTDEGGITSHAAIVSRELGKPCIIGTKVATKVLRSGDLVEVNANAGTVKILRRA